MKTMTVSIYVPVYDLIYTKMLLYLNWHRGILLGHYSRRIVPTDEKCIDIVLVGGMGYDETTCTCL